MTPHAHERNPFMLMINPEVVLAAVASSERLGQLNRHLCRPLDRLSPASADAGVEGGNDDADVGADDLIVEGDTAISV